jgi:hypothetical protein
MNEGFDAQRLDRVAFYRIHHNRRTRYALQTLPRLLR